MKLPRLAQSMKPQTKKGHRKINGMVNFKIFQSCLSLSLHCVRPALPHLPPNAPFFLAFSLLLTK